MCLLIKPIKCVLQLLLSGDEMLQATSAKCIASVLVNSPSQCSAPFIKADVPGDIHTQTHEHSGSDMWAIRAVAFFDFPSTNIFFCLLLCSLLTPSLCLHFCYFSCWLSVSLFLLVCLCCFLLCFYSYLFITVWILFVFLFPQNFIIRWGFQKTILLSCFVYRVQTLHENITPYLEAVWWCYRRGLQCSNIVPCSLLTRFL